VGRDANTFRFLVSDSFQSTRPRGARRRRSAIRGCRLGFNPRARVGRDGVTAAQIGALTVSIHAPAWGATWQTGGTGKAGPFQSTRPRGARRAPLVSVANGMKFQSTRPRGARLSIVSWRNTSKSFQSTRPRGARRSACTSTTCSLSFNPRARVGRDCVPLQTHCLAASFQSTRPRGARLADAAPG